jgi:RNA polymerase sigma factor (sigma-70 family)
MTRDEFNKLVHSISRKLYGYAYRILRDQEGSEDAVQEVFVKLWKMKTRLDEYESVEALAATMVKNYSIDQIRKQKHIEKDDKSHLTFYYDPEPSPHDKLEIDETSLSIRKIINNLPEIYRVIIHLRDIEELSYEEIAEKTGQNINTLRVNLSRARKVVRDEYKKYYNEFRGNKTLA